MASKIIIYPPPGPAIVHLRSQFSERPPSGTFAQLELSPELQSAFALRFSVFVYEQKFSAEGEIDSDDGWSWHWVALAPPQTKIAPREDVQRGCDDKHTEKEQIVAATLRLVPPSLPSPAPGVQTVSHEGLAEGPLHGQTALWNGHEPYIKIGRAATLPSHRGQGLAKLLVESAMEWAGKNRNILREQNEVTDGKTGDTSGKQWNGLALVHAQKAAKSFWNRVGFIEDEGLGAWFEEGCEHIGMWRRARMEQ